MSKKKADLFAFYIMAVVGGIFGGYAVFSVGLLGAGQSTNLIMIIMSIIGKDIRQLLIRLGFISVFAVATAATRIIKEKCRFDIRVASIIVDVICTVAVAAIPDNADSMLLLYPVIFGMAFQYNSFSGALGFTSASVFSSNNYRQFIDSITEYLCTKNPEIKRKVLFYGGSLLFFHIGVTAAVIGMIMYGKITVLMAIIPIIAAFPTVLISNRNDADKTK